MAVKKILLLLLIVCTVVSAQDEALAERIKRLGEGLVRGYTQPLVTAFGSGISSGLFHSAYSHDVLGLDIGVRGIFVSIPSSAKYFDGTALICSLGVDGLGCDSLELQNLSTVFGPADSTRVLTSENKVAVPPVIPGGFNMSHVPLVVPQLNIGLVSGLEIGVRYLPFRFQGSSVRLVGVSVKQELTKLPPLSITPIPLAIAIGGAYQAFYINDSLGEQVVNSRTWSVQLLMSTRIAVIEPFVGVGIEGTKVHFPYEFKYDIPDIDNPGGLTTVTEEIDIEMNGENEYRAMFGFSLRLGFVLLHYDYNIMPYATHNAMVALSIR
ncbi:hypothetical protein AMJ87_06510 [candidate division WOR_3 bacterium SM23_60]|uniref:Outer membrane protein beta-barrel domain-containing protein n=1 Tax=candidate division WOR_3 bacterium SM23_60 TaxID=1703780 RepID=A0A0S8GGM6_UNCW3|nr:MAG: hypothetical protein AMJ87_06510 [candidate division WOR_3 bacterium SM23_60]